MDTHLRQCYQFFSLFAFISLFRAANTDGNACPISCECTRDFFLHDSVICINVSTSLSELVDGLPSKASTIRIQDSNFPLVNAGIFARFESLKAIFLVNNEIEVVEDAAFGVANEMLQELHLSNNRITSMNSTLVQSLKGLKILELENNNFTDIAFIKYSQLTKLSLRKNNLRTLDCDLLMTAIQLEYLDLSLNGIDDVLECTSPDGLVNLEHLDLSENELRTIYPGLLQRTPRLRILQLSQNQIDSSLDALSSVNLQELQILDLCTNDIQTIGRDDFASVPNLEVLILSENQLREIISGTFEFLKKLTELRLSGMISLTNIQGGAFDGPESLKTLEITTNFNLKNFSYHAIPSLEFFNLSRNGIKYLEREIFAGSTALTQVDLSGNQFVCDCNIKWLHDVTFSWAADWSKSGRSPTCAQPINMKGLLITEVDADQFVCEPPNVNRMSEEYVYMPYDGNATLQALMSRGFPTGRWITPGGLVLQPRSDALWEKYTVEEEILSNSSVTSRLYVYHVDESDVGEYTLVAENAASGKTVSFTLLVGNVTQISLIGLGSYHVQSRSQEPDVDLSESESVSVITASGIAVVVVLIILIIILFIMSICKTDQQTPKILSQRNARLKYEKLKVIVSQGRDARYSQYGSME